MNPMQIQRIRRMVARMRADPDIQAMIKRNEFEVADEAVLVLDLNDPSKTTGIALPSSGARIRRPAAGGAASLSGGATRYSIG